MSSEAHQSASIEGKSSQTFCIDSRAYDEVTIRGCTDCSVYCMTKANTVTVESSSRSLVFVSSAKSVIIRSSSNIKLTSFSEFATISKSSEISAFLYVTTKLSIESGSNGVKLGPYNANASCIVPSGQNFWDKPCVETGSSFSIMEPSAFYPLVVPFGEEPSGILAPLPPVYSRSLAWKERMSEERRQLILEFCKKAPEFADRIQQKMSDAFKRHLSESGMDKSLRQLSSAEHI